MFHFVTASILGWWGLIRTTILPKPGVLGDQGCNVVQEVQVPGAPGGPGGLSGLSGLGGPGVPGGPCSSCGPGVLGGQPWWYAENIFHGLNHQIIEKSWDVTMGGHTDRRNCEDGAKISYEVETYIFRCGKATLPGAAASTPRWPISPSPPTSGCCARWGHAMDLTLPSY